MSLAHRSPRKIVKVRRSGRHTTPSQAGIVVGKAVQAAPAMAVTAVALTSAPHGHAAAPAGHATVVMTEMARTAPAAAPSRTYVVRPGDTLSGIARRVYGRADAWPALYRANRSVISHPSLIFPGQRLTVPGHPAAGPAPGTTGTMRGSTHQTGRVTTAPAAPGVPPSFQACVIHRESGGDPRAVNPESGAGGLFQFLPSTWHGLGYSGLPENASVQTQFEAFAKLYAQAGVSPWRPSDGCS
jgi:resuscitation-promoting factor RpfC